MLLGNPDLFFIEGKQVADQYVEPESISLVFLKHVHV